MEINIVTEQLNGLVVIKPEIFKDHRGFFMEVFHRDTYASLGLPTDYVQENHSGSVKNTLRGLHFQWEPPMGKLMRVTRGEAFLVAVDIRKGSPTFGQWYGETVNQDEPKLIWAPAGFARGFAVLSDYAEIQYLVTGTYNKACESGIAWNDPEIGIEWPVSAPNLSQKDAKAQTLAEWAARPEADNFQY
jgi:dTDP-4-dehydrorhamnose 3,5-epimerase